MWVTLSPAIIGLVGVLVGAVITTGANYMLAVRKEAAETAKDRFSRANELKTAARLIASEFSDAQAAATILVEKKHWVPGDVARDFPLDAWERDRGLLARELSLNEWSAVKLAALAVLHFRDSTTGHAPHPGDDKADDVAVEGVKPMLRDISAGLEALRPYLRDDLTFK